MTDFSPELSEKLAKLIRSLSSDRDGEVLGAAHAIIRVLQSADLDIHALAETIEQGNGHGTGLAKRYTEHEAREIYQHGVSDGKRAAEQARRNSPDFANIDGSPNWDEICQFCREKENRLGEREREFICDVSARVVWREPSERQAKWLLSIFYKLGGKKRW